MTTTSSDGATCEDEFENGQPDVYLDDEKQDLYESIGDGNQTDICIVVESEGNADHGKFLTGTVSLEYVFKRNRV